MRTASVFFLILSGFFALIASAFLLYHGYVEDVGTEPANTLLETLIFCGLSIGCAALALYESSGTGAEDGGEELPSPDRG